MPFWLLSKVCEPENGGLHGSLKVKVIVPQSWPALCDPMDCSQPDSSVHGILQARILECVVILFPGNLPDPGIKLESPAMQADSLLPELPGKLRRIEMLDKGISGAQSLR